MILQPPTAWVNLFGSGKWSRPARSGRRWPGAEPDPLLLLRRNLTLGRKCKQSANNSTSRADCWVLEYQKWFYPYFFHLLSPRALIYLNSMFELNVQCVISAALNEIGKVMTRKHAPVFHYLDKQIDLPDFRSLWQRKSIALQCFIHASRKSPYKWHIYCLYTWSWDNEEHMIDRWGHKSEWGSEAGLYDMQPFSWV